MMRTIQDKDDCIVRYKQPRAVLAPTPGTYTKFQEAFDFFNTELFADGLPQVLITLQRKARTLGYFSFKRFHGRARKTKVTVHEIALNPDGFAGNTDEEILSTLVHEQVHCWQYTHGKPSRGRYHNQEWAAKMKAMGLQASHTGKPGGKETGQRVSHYIVCQGPFAVAYKKLQARGFALHWQSATNGEQGKGKQASKTKFSCPDCGQNAWAKLDAQLKCLVCSKQMLSHAHSI